MYFGKDLVYCRKRFAHFWGKILCCVFQKLFCVFFFFLGGGGGGGREFLHWRKHLHFREHLVYYKRNLFLVFRKIFVVIQGTLSALIKKDFVYLRRYFTYFLKKDFEQFLQKDFVYFGKGILHLSVTVETKCNRKANKESRLQAKQKRIKAV